MKSFTLIFSLSISLGVFAQTGLDKVSAQLNNLLIAGTDNSEHLVWVFFKDKGDNLSYYFANPESVVSKRSLRRRSKILPPNELISLMDLPVNTDYIEELENLGLEVKQISRWFNGVSAYVTSSKIAEISYLNSVVKLDVVKKFKNRNPFKDELIENHEQDPDVQVEGMYSLDYGHSYTPLYQIRVPQVHDLGYTGEGVLICIMDTGFNNLEHEVFESVNIIGMWDFVDRDPDATQGTQHGINVLSEIGGFKEGQLIGVSFDSDFLLARTEDTGSETPVEEDNWIAALEWADSIGVDVTSTSLTYLEYDAPFESYTWQDMDGNTALITIAADLAVKLGIVVVNSASNEGFDATHNTLGAPADGDSVIAVGSVESNGERSGFSSVGPTVDGRIKPDLMALGSSVYVASSFSSSSYGLASGTSYSAPLIAGAVALLLSVDSTLSPMSVLNLLRHTGSNSSYPNNLEGWGIPNILEAVNLLNTSGELTFFTGNYLDEVITLTWATSSEGNIDYFEVERRVSNSSDTGEWQVIETVEGTGSITEGGDYTYNDDISSVDASTIEYRLKQYDFDGSFVYSDVVSINLLRFTTVQLFQNYPNPFNLNTVIRYFLPNDSRIKISVYDILGNQQEVLFEGLKPRGEDIVIFNAEGRSSGVYFITLQAENYSQTIKATLIK
ncbi:MAG: S8 family peptidase [Ignavibacteria bacterium]|jgi:subtilisin family serine protease